VIVGRLVTGASIYGVRKGHSIQVRVIVGVVGIAACTVVMAMSSAAVRAVGGMRSGKRDARVSRDVAAMAQRSDAGGGSAGAVTGTGRSRRSAVDLCEAGGDKQQGHSEECQRGRNQALDGAFHGTFQGTSHGNRILHREGHRAPLVSTVLDRSGGGVGAGKIVENCRR